MIDQPEVRMLVDVMLGVVQLQQYMAVEEIQRIEYDHPLARAMDDRSTFTSWSEGA